MTPLGLAHLFYSNRFTLKSKWGLIAPILILIHRLDTPEFIHELIKVAVLFVAHFRPFRANIG